MAKQILAVIVGIVIVMGVIIGVEAEASKLYPVPSGVDFENAHALERLIQQMPRGAYLGLLAAYALSSFCGGLAATIISGRQSINPAAAVGVLGMMGGILNILGIPPGIPHPLWFVIASQFMYVPFTLFAFLLFRRPESPLST